jgi:hypothetical protein
MTDEDKTDSRLQRIQDDMAEHEMNVGDILAEVRQFTTIAGVLVGFLLTVSVAYLDRIPEFIERIFLVLAFAFTATAMLIFMLPPFYHHLRFPMDQKQLLQFSWRSHKFIVWGIVPLYLGVYFSMLLALFQITGLYGFILATVIVVTPFVAYELRKIGDPKELG